MANLSVPSPGKLILGIFGKHIYPMSHALRWPPLCLKKGEKQSGAVVREYRFFRRILKHLGPILAHWMPRGDHFGVIGCTGVHLFIQVWILDDFREKCSLHFEPFWAPLELTFFVLEIQELKISVLFEDSVVRSLFEAICGQIQDHSRHQKHSFRVWGAVKIKISPMLDFSSFWDPFRRSFWLQIGGPIPIMTHFGASLMQNRFPQNVFFC